MYVIVTWRTAPTTVPLIIAAELGIYARSIVFPASGATAVTRYAAGHTGEESCINHEGDP